MKEQTRKIIFENIENKVHFDLNAIEISFIIFT